MNKTDVQEISRNLSWARRTWEVGIRLRHKTLVSIWCKVSTKIKRIRRWQRDPCSNIIQGVGTTTTELGTATQEDYCESGLPSGYATPEEDAVMPTVEDETQRMGEGFHCTVYSCTPADQNSILINWCRPQQKSFYKQCPWINAPCSAHRIQTQLLARTSSSWHNKQLATTRLAQGDFGVGMVAASMDGSSTRTSTSFWQDLWCPQCQNPGHLAIECGLNNQCWVDHASCRFRDPQICVHPIIVHVQWVLCTMRAKEKSCAPQIHDSFIESTI